MSDALDLRSALGAAPIVRDVVRASGPEAADFLQGQLSQDITTLRADGLGEASAPALLLQPTGKVDAWLRVTRLADDDFLLDVDAGHGEAVRARLARFKLRTKVDIEASTWGGLALRGPGASSFEAPAGVHVLPAFWPGVEGVDLLSDGDIALAGVTLVDVDALEALRVECGVPAMGAELTPDTIPAEAGQWLIDASASFTKGCYTGQELVARIDSRGGNVPHPIRGLLVTGDAPVASGATVLHDGAAVGSITSAARSAVLGVVALARLRRAVEVGAAVEIGVDGAESRSAQVVELPLR